MMTGTSRLLLATAAFAFVLSGCSTADKMMAPAPKPAPVAAKAPPPPPPAPKPMPAPTYVIEGVNFDHDSAKLKPAAMAKLDEVASGLSKHSDVPYQVRGYTDSTGKANYNLGLSERRAKSVRDYLVKKGASASQLRSVNGFGEEDPVASNRTKQGRAQNRRVEIKPVN
ncbi:MAG: OOP family OmpA-OmpF porin [Gammaproteobacteria bacterium]|jgi:OOP family OmpA-OmpF porin